MRLNTSIDLTAVYSRLRKSFSLYLPVHLHNVLYMCLVYAIRRITAKEQSAYDNCSTAHVKILLSVPKSGLCQHVTCYLVQHCCKIKFSIPP